MQPQRKRITSELLDRLNDLADANAMGPEFSTALKQVQFRARALKKTDPAEYYAVEGICASLDGNVQSAIESFEAGLDAAGWSEFLFHNYATAMDDMAQYDVAASVAARAIEKLAHSSDAMDTAVSIALHAGDLRTARNAKIALDKTAGEVVQYFAGLDTFVERLGPDDERIDRVNRAIRQARSFIKEVGPRRMTAMSRFTEGLGGDPHLVLNYAPADPKADIRDLERALFVRLAESSEDEGVYDWLTISLSRKKPNANVLHAG